ncbi:hypothetical protein MK805_00475 [Shimazuella sp. AN120528]|uniref:hypothetical protein n=1 Tax=Shimazuella soli TaxID=1892854 RepID=UPI001F0E90A7|nr:hypothetical protein [Shimazuella soli]MCH5583455.1 hypothetical protein [Shimazuella soli]
MSVTPLPAGTKLDEFTVVAISDLPLSLEDQAESEKNWLEENPTLTDDPVHIIVEVSEVGRHYRVYRTTYKAFKWLRKNGKPGAVVNVVTIIQCEDSLVFAKSGAQTHHAGKIVAVGGMLDGYNRQVESSPYLQLQGRAEARDEPGCRQSSGHLLLLRCLPRAAGERQLRAKKLLEEFSQRWENLEPLLEEMFGL